MRRVRQQWVIAGLLIVSLLAELPQITPASDGWWLVPGSVLMAGPALTAFRWPVGSSVAAFGVLVGWSAAQRRFSDLADPVGATATVAIIVMIVVVVRTTPVRTAVALAGLLTSGGFAAELLQDRPRSAGELVWGWLVPAAVVFALPAAVGWYLRYRDNTARAAVVAARQRERLDLARELHDVIAHHVGGIVVQAQAAQVVAGTDIGAGARVLPVIEKAGTDALAAMRRMVSVLREDDLTGDAPLRTVELIADLHAVAATVPGGTPVRLTVDLAEPIPPEVATSVLRLVQESVTNARRHATGAQEISATVRAGDGIAQVLVSDDGVPGGDPKRYGGGFGLIGMRERVQRLGGRFSAGRGPDGGWQVTADVPLAATPAGG